MSTKSFISAEEHLAKFGVTVEQAFDFIFANLDNPELIYAAARQNGVTNSMLNEITGVSVDVIEEYFTSTNNPDLVPQRLDYTSILFNTDIGSFESFVSFNNNIGVLSTVSLREEVQSLIDFSAFYEFPFTERYGFQSNDGVYDADELGVSNLNNVEATDENIESIFYGTLVNMFSTLDKTELNQIKVFDEDGDTESFNAILIDAFSDSPENRVWTDEELTDLVVSEAVYLHNHYIQDDFVIGLFDHSYLGYAPVIH